MAEIIRMPKLSDTMTEGVVSAWHKKVGDKVKSGELLAEIETDKATMEFESYADGVLLHIGIEAGKGAPIDALLAIIGKEGEDISALLNGTASTKEEPTVSPAAQPVATIPTAVAPETTSTTPAATLNNHGRIKVSPLAKKMASDRGIDVSLVTGSGDGGRIVRRDIENFKTPVVSTASHIAAPSYGEEGWWDENISQMRKTIARRLAESKFTAPHFYLTMEIDMDNAIEARKTMNAAGSVKISFNDFVIKAAALALRKHPKINSSWRNDAIRHYQHIHVGVAVAVEEGLLVPVVRFADTKGLATIGIEVKNFAERAKQKKLQPQDWEGNTFTISNLGMFGIDDFTAIINPPDACILAVGSIKAVPVVKNGQVVAGNVMKLTLSCDHRVVDGASGAAFLLTVKEYIENPVTMLI